MINKNAGLFKISLIVIALCVLLFPFAFTGR